MATGLGVDVNPDELEEQLGVFVDLLETKIKIAVGGVAAMVAATAKKTKSFRDQDGRLRASIRNVPPVMDRDGLITADILGGGAEVYYAPYIEFGTEDDLGRQLIKPRLFMTDALAEHAIDLDNFIDLAVEQAAKEAGLS